MRRNWPLLTLVVLVLSLAASAAGQDADFTAVYAQFKAGDAYKAAPTGLRRFDTFVNGTALDNTLLVPETYDPAKRWPLRVQLHGGVGRMPPENPAQVRPLSTNRIPGERAELVLQPRAWGTSEWWERNQAANVVSLVEQVKKIYNVDESRTYITGISDGGTGVYFFAMREVTKWAACLPLNGHPSVLNNPQVGADGDLFISNLVNCPLYLVNGGKDRLYPAASVQPWVETMKRGGAAVVFNVYPDAGHDTSWWPEERADYEAFLAGHPRDPHPARVSWATERTDRYNRFRWLVIDKLGARPTDAALDDVNTLRLAGREIPLYSRRARWGRVDVSRDGNTFAATTRGVEQFTLLLSPDVVDFTRPVKVVVNGRPVFDARVRPDVATLRKWHDRDHDRTMLFGGELTIHVP